MVTRQFSIFRGFFACAAAGAFTIAGGATAADQPTGPRQTGPKSAKPATPAKAQPVSPPARLTALKDKTDDPSHADYDFGVIRFGDPDDVGKHSPSDEHLTMMTGRKHFFEFFNYTNQGISITGSRNGPGCSWSQALIVNGQEFGAMPFTVAPNRKIRIMMAFDHSMIGVGPASETAEFLGKDGKHVVATITMHGAIEGAFKPSVNKLGFGTVRVGRGATREFKITMSSNTPMHMPPGGILQLVSSNPAIKVQIVPHRPMAQGIGVKGNTIEFTSEVVSELPADVTLHIRASVARNARPGTLDGKVGLIVPGMPLYVLVQSSQIPVTGKVVLGKRRRRR